MLQDDSFTLSVACASAPQACFSELLGARVLALLDVENLSYTLAPQRDVDYGRLRADLVASADEVHGHVIATIHDGDGADRHAHECFRACGWTSHLTRRVTAGRYRRTNADPQILLHAGQLIERERPDIVVLGSADGELGYELALFGQRLSTRVRFMTLSAPGALAPWSTPTCCCTRSTSDASCRRFRKSIPLIVLSSSRDAIAVPGLEILEISNPALQPFYPVQYPPTKEAPQ